MLRLSALGALWWLSSFASAQISTTTRNPLSVDPTTHRINETVAVPSGKSFSFESGSTVTVSGTITLPSGMTIASPTLTGTVTLPSGISITSPVLTTPNLGTPSAGTLTNCTGLPAGGVAYTRTGTGTTSATEASRVENSPYNAKTDFGAAGDNTTDDTLALQRMFDAMVATGRAGYLPTGEYKITSALTLSTAVGVVLYGDAAGPDLRLSNTVGGSIIHQTADADAITYTTGSIDVYNPSFSRLQIIGPGMGTSTHAGIRFTKSSAHGYEKVDFQQVTINGFSEGVRASAAITCSNFGNCDFGNNITGVYFDGASDGHSNTFANTLIGGELSGNVTGFRFSNGYNIRIVECEIGGIYQQSGLTMDGANDVTVQGGSSDVFITSGSFFNITGTGGILNLYNHTFNQLNGAGATGVLVTNGTGLNIYDPRSTLSNGLYTATGTPIGIYISSNGTINTAKSVTTGGTFTWNGSSGNNFVFGTGGSHGSPGSNLSGVLMFQGLPTFTRNWSLGNAVYADEFALLYSSSVSAATGDFVSGSTTNPKIPVFWVDGANNRTSIGHATNSQPSGTSTLNVEGSFNVSGATTLAGTTISDTTVWDGTTGKWFNLRGGTHGTPGSSLSCGGIYFTGKTGDAVRNWAVLNEAWADDFGIFVSSSTSTGATSYQSGATTNPGTAVFWIDGANNRTSIGHAASTQPSGTATLNVEGTLAIAGGTPITKVLSATATLDFPSTSAQNSADLTITVTGAAVGDTVSLGVPNGSVNANTSFSGWVSATNTVTVRFNNYSSGSVDPASGTFRATVTQF